MENWARAALQAGDYETALTTLRAMGGDPWAIWSQAQCLHRLQRFEELFELVSRAPAPDKYAGRFYSLAADTARELGDRERFDRFAARAAEALDEPDYFEQARAYHLGPHLLRVWVRSAIGTEAFRAHLALLELAEARQDANLACEGWEMMAELRRFPFEADYLGELVHRWESLQSLLNASQRQEWEEGRRAYHAGASGEVELMAGLLAAGVPVDACDVAGRTAAWGAAMTGKVGMLEFLKEHRAALDRPNYQGLTPLMAAVMEGHEPAVDFLLPKLARVGHRGPGGNTALHFAVERKRREIAELLLRRGASAEVRNADGKTPRDLASEELRDLFPPPPKGFLGRILGS